MEEAGWRPRPHRIFLEGLANAIFHLLSRWLKYKIQVNIDLAKLRLQEAGLQPGLAFCNREETYSEAPAAPSTYDSLIY